MTLPAPAAVPPMVLLLEGAFLLGGAPVPWCTQTPKPPFLTWVVPSTPTPILLAATTFPLEPLTRLTPLAPLPEMVLPRISTFEEVSSRIPSRALGMASWPPKDVPIRLPRIGRGWVVFWRWIPLPWLPEMTFP